jgi:hypothetical protein
MGHCPFPVNTLASCVVTSLSVSAKTTGMSSMLFALAPQLRGLRGRQGAANAKGRPI